MKDIRWVVWWMSARGNFIKYKTVPGAQRTTGVLFLSAVLLSAVSLLLQNKGERCFDPVVTPDLDICLSGGLCPDQRELWWVVPHSKDGPHLSGPRHHQHTHFNMGILQSETVESAHSASCTVQNCKEPKQINNATFKKESKWIPTFVFHSFQFNSSL